MLGVVLIIVLGILALKILALMLLLVSCNNSAKRQEAENARFQALLGEAPAAVALSGVNLIELRSRFDFTPLMEEAAERAVRAMNAPEEGERDLRWSEDEYLLDGGALYLSARYISSAGHYTLVLCADLAACSVETVYAAEGGENIDLLSADDGVLFWYDGDAVLYDAAQKKELVREKGELYAVEGFVWRYVFTPGTVNRESILFFGQEGRELVSYTFPLEGDTYFLISISGVVRGVAYAEADGVYAGVDVRTGRLLDTMQCARHLAYEPFAYGWEKGEGNALCRETEEVFLDQAWVSSRSERVAELLQFDRATGGAVSAELLADGTPCIRFEVSYRVAWWGEYNYSLLFYWTEEDTLEYLGCPQLCGCNYGGIVCRAEET